MSSEGEAPRDLTSTVVRGISLAAAGYIFAQILNLAFYVALARLLTPEDFGEFGRAAGIPSLIFWLGGTEPARFEAARGDLTRLPGLHSSLWAPDREPTLKTGAAALTVAALELLGKP